MALCLRQLLQFFFGREWTAPGCCAICSGCCGGGIVSKKIENHRCAVALHYMVYNFGRIHKTLRVTPAMQAGLADHVWTIEEIAKLAD